MEKTISITAERLSPKRTTVETEVGELTVGEEGSPLEYLLGSLAGCFNVIGTLVADDMDIDIESLAFDIEGDIDTSRYMGDSTEPRAGFQDIRLGVTVDADADEETLEEWLSRVQDRCPVAENLQNGTNLGVSLNVS